MSKISKLAHLFLCAVTASVLVFAPIEFASAAKLESCACATNCNCKTCAHACACHNHGTCHHAIDKSHS